MDEQESEDEIEAIDFKKMIVFNHQGMFIQVWNCIDIFCCLMSGYVYAWIGCFGIKKDVYILSLINITLEVIFTLSIIIRFLTDYVPLGENTPVKDIFLIGERYINTGFMLDFIPWIPITFFVDAANPDKFYRLFFFVKICRMVKGIKVFSVPILMQKTKKIMQERTQREIENDPNFDDDNMDKDQTNI